MPNPYVYASVRAVGTFRPKFSPTVTGQIFVDELNVIGTAFWLKNEKCLVTCAHVVQGLLGAPLELTGLLVVGNAGKYRRTVIGAIDIEHDLAILRPLNASNNPLDGAELDAEVATGLEIVDEYQDVGTAVAYAGFPLGNQLLDQLHSPTYAEGVVGVKCRVSGGQKQVQISGAVVGGFSGSPVVLKEDPTKLLGALSAGPQQGGNIFMAISWEHVRAIAALANS